MFEQMLVPLDGSKLAEVSLLVASMLSRKLGASAILIHIIEQDAPQEIHGDRHLTNVDEALRYLKQIAEKYFSSDKVSTHVHLEKVQDVARSIVDHTGEMTPDLIVMCTHGEGGLLDIVVGSIAQQVIGRGKTPILLVQPVLEASAEFTFQKVLVALDGNVEHDGALQVAAEFAQKIGASLHLLTVVQTLGSLHGERAASGWLMPGATRAILDMEEEGTREHLENLADPWRKAGLVVTAEVRRGDPAQQILAGAASAHADLIVLATHGKSGMKAFWSSSVGPKVVSTAHIPLLLIPAKK
jgi:nucleotide-binding universal stress UspA family protein